MKRKYLRDKKGRFKARYIRPPRKGTIDRLLWDTCLKYEAIEAERAMQRIENVAKWFKNGKAKVKSGDFISWNVVRPTS